MHRISDWKDDPTFFFLYQVGIPDIAPDIRPFIQRGPSNTFCYWNTLILFLRENKKGFNL